MEQRRNQIIIGFQFLPHDTWALCWRRAGCGPRTGNGLCSGPAGRSRKHHSGSGGPAWNRTQLRAEGPRWPEAAQRSARGAGPPRPAGLKLRILSISCPRWLRSEEMQRQVGCEAGGRVGRPLETTLSFVTPGPRSFRLGCYLGLAGAEVPYANGSLLGGKEILQMALCNLL